MRFEKKITPKNLFGKPRDLVKDIVDGQIRYVYKVGGTINGVKDGVSTYGPWYKFIGEFLAIDMITGEEIRSTAVCLQEPLQGLILDQLKSDSTVEFAAEIGLRKRDDLEVGYEYIMRPIVAPKEPDHISRLKDMMNSGDPAPQPQLISDQTAEEAAEGYEEEPKTKVKAKAKA